MIAGKIEDLKIYSSVCPEFENIYSFVKEYFDAPKADGSYELIPDKLSANIATYNTGDAATKNLEAHRRYADVQIVLKGAERIDWAHISTCTDEISEEFSKGGDIGFYADPEYVSSMVLDAGTFVYLLPEDAHKPCVNAGADSAEVTKVVFKIKL
ncbi:MAG: YhcH/YjgK/YiaL family protein [Clostridia bacterium]|nr:YhcH/YjgK/YiaL family protein [Clostridia bacterium]